MATRDYYEILGLTPAADGAAIDQAYWQLARRYQHEAVNDARASTLLDELNEAYNVLGVPYMRADYDAARREALAEATGKVGKRKRRQQPERESAVGPSVGDMLGMVPRKVLAGAGLATVAIGALALAWALGYGLIALGLIACFAAAGGGTYWALGRATEIGQRPRDAAAAAPAVKKPKAAEKAPVRAPRAAPVPRQPRPVIEPTPARIRRPAASASELRDSTAAMRERFRQNAALNSHDRPDDDAPDTTLVEIFKSEREMESRDGADEPLSAVMDILRGARSEASTGQ
jgi:hypothetical protein